NELVFHFITIKYSNITYSLPSPLVPMARTTLTFFALFIVLSSLCFNPIDSSRDIAFDNPITQRTLLSQKTSDIHPDLIADCQVCMEQCGSCTCCIAKLKH
ncbi:hypothetical protein AABB24_007546, partial [Solanum stoloniferum]